MSEEKALKIWVHVVGHATPSAVYIAKDQDIDALKRAIRDHDMVDCNNSKPIQDWLVTLSPPKSGAPPPAPLPYNLELQDLLEKYAGELKMGDERGNCLVYATVPPKPAADLPLMIAAAFEKLQSRKFWIRHWAGADIKAQMLDMPSTYTEFRSLLFLAFGFPTHGKVYYFPNNVLNIAQRVALCDDATFDTFLALPRSNQLLLYLWRTPGEEEEEDGSPNNKEPANEANDSQSRMSSGVSDISNRAMQETWALIIKDVDEWKCVVCQRASTKLKAAHIVPANTPKAELKEVGLPSAYEACNGVTLCRECHSLFDTGCFYFDIDGKLVVSAALVAHEPDWKARQGTLIHRTAERAHARNWPEPRMIEWRSKRLCQAASR